MANPPSNNPSTPLNTRAEALIQGRGMNHQRRDVRRGGGRHRNRDDGIDARGRQGQEDVPNDERRRHRPGNRGTHHLRQADNNAPLGHQFAPNRANGNAGSTTVNGTASNKRITRVANRRAPINTTSDIADSNRTIGEEETKDDSPMHTRSGLPFQMRDNRGGDASRRDNNRRHHQTNSRVASSTHLPSAQEREYTMASNMAAAMIRSEIDRTSNQPSSGSTDAAVSSTLVDRDATYNNDTANDIQHQPTRLVAHRGNLVQSGGRQGQSRSNGTGRIQQEQIRQSNATAPTQRGSRTSREHIHIARVDGEQGGINQRGYVDREQGGIAQRGAGVESVTSISQILHNENSIASASPLPSYRQAFNSNHVDDTIFDDISIPLNEDNYGVRVEPVYDDVTFHDEEEQGDSGSIVRVDRVGINRHMARVLRDQNDRISSMERSLNMFTAQITDQMEDIISEINQGSTRHRQTAPPMSSNQPLPSPDHTSGTIDPYERIPVHLAPSIAQFHGQEMTTSPVMFIANDEVYWRYTSDIFQAVRIMEVEAPTTMRRQPIYHVMLMNNGQEYDVRHDELFISSSRASILDPQGVLMANSIDLSAMDRMNLAAMDNQATPSQIQLWSAMDNSNLKLSDLISSTKEITLPSDSLVAVKNAYASFSMALLAATRGKVALPKLNELSPMISIRSLMVPPTTYPKYPIAMSFYQSIAQVISNQISNESFAKAAPKARTFLRTVINGEKDGIDQLNHLLTNIFPFLGAYGFDPTEVINALTATDGMQIEAFIEQALDIESQLTLAGVPTQPNQLIKRFFSQLMRSSTFQPLLATKNHMFQEEMRLSGNKKEYTQESISSLSNYILQGNSSTTIAIQATSNGLSGRDLSLLPQQQSQRSTRFNKSPFNKKIFAAMGALRQGIIEDARVEHEGDEDDATVYDEADDEFDAKYFTDEGQRELISNITPILKSLNIDVEQIPEELFQDLILAAISGMRDHDKNCEVCNGRHDADRCRARGIHFLHPTLRKAVEQYNAIHGDKPKSPPLPLTPPTARFGGKKFKAMTITSVSVEDSKEDVDASTQSGLTEGNGTAQVANERGGVATIRDNATEQHHSDTSRLATSDSSSGHPRHTSRTEPTGILPVPRHTARTDDTGRKMTSSTCDCCELSDDNFTATNDSVTSLSLHALTNPSTHSESKLILRSANANIEDDNVPFDEGVSAESKTLDHSAQIDNVLNVVSKELEQSINSGNISITPQYGLIDLPKGNSDIEPTIASIDGKERSIEDVLQTADYAVYNEQVNC